MSRRDISPLSGCLHPICSLAWHNQIKQRWAWLLLGWVTAKRSWPCKQLACPATGGDSEVTFKPLAPRLKIREG
ncbi:hypothetical protein J6590_068171 [Homalodisca vitripennis]|nr:hypothetical protein J6590_068171 [Homalodisca vitripennis]